MNEGKQQMIADEVVRRAECTRMVVQGLSMGKEWRNVTTVDVAGAFHRTPRLGDVVLMRTQTGRIVHRAIWRRQRDGKTMWLTKGDGNATFDSWQGEENILGVVIRAEEGSGRCLHLRRWRGLLAGLMRGVCRQAGV